MKGYLKPADSVATETLTKNVFGDRARTLLCGVGSVTVPASDADHQALYTLPTLVKTHKQALLTLACNEVRETKKSYIAQQDEKARQQRDRAMTFEVMHALERGKKLTDAQKAHYQVMKKASEAVNAQK
jgi:hypothetical protein